MNENSTSVGRAAIDAYLDAVEEALLAAHAPRNDRAQVMQDLETQIADMLAREPAPLTEEMVQAVIARLEPPSNFAATYGNGKTSQAGSPKGPQEGPQPGWWTWLTASRPGSLRWSYVAAASLALLVLSVLMPLGHMTRVVRIDAEFILFMMIVGILATSCALVMAYKQFRAAPDRAFDHDLLLAVTTGYGLVAPPAVLVLLAIMTEGAALVLLGVAAYVYLHYRFVRWLKRYVAEWLPPRPEKDSAIGAGEHSAAPPLGNGMTVPAI